MATPQRQQTAGDIRTLKGIEHIRHRPGMYIGAPDAHGLHHLVYEVVDNSIDEAMAGRCDAIQIVLHRDNSVTVSDNGGGIPVEIHPEEGVSTLELVMTNTNTSGKFGGGAYKVSGGLHGIGVKAVNALSSHVIAEVHRDGYIWRQSYEKGVPMGPVEPIAEMQPDDPTGTFITFMPDPTIFRETQEFVFSWLMQRFREMAYVTRGVTISLIDEREPIIPHEMTFYFEGGIRAFVRYLNRTRQGLHEVISGTGESTFSYLVEGVETEGTMEIEFAFQYTDATTTTELAFANTINTGDGGTHLTGLRTALTRVINNYARKNGLLKDKDSNFTGRHTLEGLTAIVSIKHPNPQFESQTKVKLMNPEVNSGTATVVAEIFADYLESHPKEGRAIVDKCMTTMRIQEALDKQRELLLNDRKSFLTNTTLPGKLADCSDKGMHTEVYLVEGDSAGGSAKQGRDRHFQAILPLRGKILNTERANLNKILDSTEIKALISAIGTGIRDDFNLEKARYGRIIIMTDADHDGAHIRTLLLTFFFRYMMPLIQGGCLYIAQPPIFRLEYKKQIEYVYPENNLTETQLLTKSLTRYAEGDKVGVQRYKGLGEMNPEQLWETTMNPEKRTLLQVTLEDAAEADRTFDMLMGPSVPPRKKFIVTHSKDATLDI